MRTRALRKTVTVLALSALAGSLVFAGDAARTRGRGSSERRAERPASVSSSPAGRTRPSGGGGSVGGRVSGHATWGRYGGYRGGYYGPGGYWGWGGYWGPSFWWWWGYPFYDAWWSPYYYGVPYAPYGVAVGERAVVTGPAVIETAVRPKKAAVAIDGEQVGRARDYNGTWDVLRVDPGEHVVTFSYPGYRTLRVRFDARPGRVYRFDEWLERGEGVEERTVAVEPEATTQPPAAPAPTAPPPAPGTAIESAPPAPVVGEALKRGLLRIDVTPGDAAVYLDGEFLARADELTRLHGAIPVAVGSHRVEAARPGYATQSIEVEVGPEGPAKVSLALEKD